MAVLYCTMCTELLGDPPLLFSAFTNRWIKKLTKTELNMLICTWWLRVSRVISHSLSAGLHQTTKGLWLGTISSIYFLLCSWELSFSLQTYWFIAMMVCITWKSSLPLIGSHYHSRIASKTLWYVIATTTAKTVNIHNYFIILMYYLYVTTFECFLQCFPAH